MTDNTPLSPQPLHRLADTSLPVLTTAELRRHGVQPAVAHRRCRPGGPWQMPLPGVFVLHHGPLTGAETLHAVLRYTGGPFGDAVITGLAALERHGFTAVPPANALDRVDVLVPQVRRLRSVGIARIVRTRHMPEPVRRGGFPLAPVARALADAVGRLSGDVPVRRLLTEAVRGGYCEPHEVLRELSRIRPAGQPQVVAAVETLLSESRALAEESLLAAVRHGGLPAPCWNVGLWLPDGPFLCAVDAYWPERAVAVRIEGGPPRQRGQAVAEPGTALRRRQTLAGLGITLVRPTPRELRCSPGAQADAIRAALRAAADRPPATYVVVLPR
ncbi:hypothetical protein [Streptomyces marincola]|uniref:Transcriptional regulator, AbiEi antitoxin, Type IV TA system n=1 Tax=Streptomyces marincola TaxID=2878388 RepID=A0A1W7D0Y5_9ACTN|nr:hypothetical protein [Streptomyces marincola]ARQ70655.1 hypothetical protein CAG99_19040 [Streptomyces marincola]